MRLSGLSSLWRSVKCVVDVAGAGGASGRGDLTWSVRSSPRRPPTVARLPGHSRSQGHDLESRHASTASCSATRAGRRTWRLPDETSAPVRCLGYAPGRRWERERPASSPPACLSDLPQVTANPRPLHRSRLHPMRIFSHTTGSQPICAEPLTAGSSCAETRSRRRRHSGLYQMACGRLCMSGVKAFRQCWRHGRILGESLP